MQLSRIKYAPKYSQLPDYNKEIISVLASSSSSFPPHQDNLFSVLANIGPFAGGGDAGHRTCGIFFFFLFTVNLFTDFEIDFKSGKCFIAV